jgi:hypothetical protein
MNHYLLQEYKNELEQYFVLQQSLNTYLDATVRVQPHQRPDWQFQPGFSSFLLQLKHWPADMIPLPLSEWVIPVQGTIDRAGTKWRFGFHGQGVTFWNAETNHDVSTEYSAQGQCAITKWTMRLYLETYPTDISLKDRFLRAHEQLFDLLVEQGYLWSVPPRLSGDDQTYVMTNNGDT